MGHSDVKTTMIYTHVLNQSGGRGVRSPIDSITLDEEVVRPSSVTSDAADGSHAKSDSNDEGRQD